MADEENNETTEEQGGNGGNATRTAVKAAAAAAATGAAAVAVKKALGARSNGSENGEASGESKKSGNSQSLMKSVAAGSWDAAQDALVPLAGDAAAAAGKFLAESGPDVVKEQIVPKFIDAFNEAK
jgi:hypothetical protein